MDVTIVGAGLSGLTLALALAKAGLPSLLVDKISPHAAVAKKNDIRTTAISLSSRRLFTVLGVWQKIADNAYPIHDILVSEAGSESILHYDSRTIGQEPMGHIINNNALKKSLLSQLEKYSDFVSFIDNRSVIALEIRKEQALLTLDDGKVIVSKLVIAADGRDSRIRTLADIQHTTLDYHQSAIVDTIQHSKRHHNLAHERFLPGGPLALLPLQENHSAMVWSERTAVAKRIANLDDEFFSTALKERFGDSRGILKSIGPRAVYRLAITVAQSGISKRVALIGDSFHCLHPIAGQGFNISVRDIAVLAELIVDAGRLGLDIGSTPVLKKYQRQRRFDIMTMGAATDMLTRLFSNDFITLKTIRCFGLFAMNNIKPLKNITMLHAMGMLGILPKLLNGKTI
ncbi:ubiquinone biosynthesis hydroxylase, UbiH/UbiF/VisC/COQ6 family protein [Candidatus Endolissoclinum faulkneri L2]|uniref:Ubiquinone biosynthesis hydroxylase, UbiH/UbiF/VisC/COQ6 family protein n=1 Tax=Candidatus Endolissoclinum faulkneri L2 TaxID=1193729 RepID=K7YL73_9PROT|nr:UbiH/UbiF/VisC/COQ6 family ubiquinone biosynthesis hydroxylase [Candidatus Endolissoclinum faulkneri]AFX98232.1 ubiquinone biosynthesis hydroxylase, UbiH/UbiF/VisC/COQ6 family protein [Candidatus Endolissoclinum faulkneri L2]